MSPFGCLDRAGDRRPPTHSRPRNPGPPSYVADTRSKAMQVCADRAAQIRGGSEESMKELAARQRGP